MTTPSSRPIAELLTPLPAGFAARPLLVADAAEACDLVRKVDLAACGETSTTEAELAADITSTPVAEARGGIAVEQSGKLIAILLLFDDVADNRGGFFDLFIDPELKQGTAVAIADPLIAAAEARIGQRMAELHRAGDVIKTALYAADAAFLSAAVARGYEHHRNYWRMRIDHPTAPTPTLLPAGYEFVDFDNSERMWQQAYELSSTAFEDHYDFQRMSFESWVAHLSGGVNDQSQWRFAKSGDELIGYAFGSNRFAQEAFGYVASIGVLRAHRGRGIARALLLDAFARDFSLGRIGTLLHCDATNPTGANRLYEGVGMRADRSYLAYRKFLGIRA